MASFGWYRYREWWTYYMRARTVHGVDSPFVFEFLEETIENPRDYYALAELQGVRHGLLASPEKVTVTDFGAGSAAGNGTMRQVADVAQYSLSNPADCRMLFNLSRWLRPKTVLELGTSLGLSAMHLASPSGETRVFTLEGDPAIADIARRTMSRVGFSNIEVVTGAFEKTLEPTLKKVGDLDLVFIDGNHRKEPVLQYFDLCLPHLHAGSVVVVDDIYWSPDMTEAWEVLKNHPRVTLTIDLYFKGLLFFRPEISQKAHFTLIKRVLKPFNIGLFR